MPEQQELTYADVLRFLVRGLKYALVAAVAAAVVTYMLSERMQPQYEANARLLLTPPNQEVRDLLGSGVTASALDSSAYREAATTESVLLDALELVGVSSPTLQDAENLAERTNVTYEDGRNSSIVSIKVKSNDARNATGTANAIAASLLDWERGRATAIMDRTIGLLEEQIAKLEAEIAAQRATPNASSSTLDELVGLRNNQHDQLVLARSRIPGSIGSLEWFQEAVGPAPQVAPRPTLYAAIAFIAGIIAAYAVMMIGSAASTRIRTLEELAAVAGVPVLAAYGKGFLKHKSRDPYEALSFLAARLSLSFQRQPTKLMLVSADDRIDTRDLSVALARSFAEGGRRTLFIASDPRRPFVKVGYGQMPTISDLRNPSLEQHLLTPTRDLAPNTVALGDVSLDLIVPTKELSSATQLVARGFSLMLRRLQRNYEVVVIDAAPLSTAPDALVVAPESSGILLVVKFQGLERETLKSALSALGPQRRAVVGVIAMDMPGGVDLAITHGTEPLRLADGFEVAPRTVAN